MIKHLLTILTIISLFFLLLYSWLLSPREPLLAYSPQLKESFISPTIWQIDSSQPLEEISLSSQKPLPSYKVIPLSTKSYAIHFDPSPTGWFGTVWIHAQGTSISHQKKTFLNLSNPQSASLKIVAFSPVASKNYKKSLELCVQKTGSLNGLRLEIEQANQHTNVYYLPDLWLEKGDVWQILFGFDQENLSIGNKQIFIPHKLSDSTGIISFVESSQREIQDTLIYRKEKSSSAGGWGTSSFQRKIERLKQMKGFPYPVKNTSDFILFTKGVRFNQTIKREKTNIPFRQGNTQVEVRNT